MWEEFIELFMPDMCIQGGHRKQGEYVKNIMGGMYCWHGDCMKASLEDVIAREERKPSPFNYWYC